MVARLVLICACLSDDKALVLKAFDNCCKYGNSDPKVSRLKSHMPYTLILILVLDSVGRLDLCSHIDFNS